MSTQPLVGFFQSEKKQRCALGHFFGAWGGQWQIDTQLLDLYDASRIAFDPSSDADRAFPCFEKIYADLKGYWQVFRSSTPEAKHWTARQIFEKLIGQFSDFSSYGPFNMLTFPESGKESRLEASLVQMRGIKERKTYPHMTVSKFLHF